MVLKGEEATAATYAVTSSFVTMTGDRVVYNQSSTSISYKPFTLKRRITESNVMGASPCEKPTERWFSACNCKRMLRGALEDRGQLGPLISRKSLSIPQIRFFSTILCTHGKITSRIAVF